ncbi:Penicillin-binding protein 1A [compost metagenome]
MFGIARAVRNNFTGGARVQGGSTITQQVAKNFFLSSERSLERKIKEIIVAIQMAPAATKGSARKL